MLADTRLRRVTMCMKSTKSEYESVAIRHTGSTQCLAPFSVAAVRHEGAYTYSPHFLDLNN